MVFPLLQSVSSFTDVPTLSFSYSVCNMCLLWIFLLLFSHFFIFFFSCFTTSPIECHSWCCAHLLICICFWTAVTVLERMNITPVMFWSIVCTHLSLPVTMTTVDLALVWVDSDRIIHLYYHRLLTLLSNSCNINDFVFVCSGGRGGPGMVAVGRRRIEASAFAVIFSKKAGRFSSR